MGNVVHLPNPCTEIIEVCTAVPFLDRVIDINCYPIAQAAVSNPPWRPVGLGVMGLHDVFSSVRLPF